MKLSTIFLISFFIVSLLVSVILISYSVYLHNNHLIHQVENHLETIVSLKEKQLGQYAELKKQRAVDFSSDGFIKGQLIGLYAGENIGEVDKVLYPYIENEKMPLDKDVYEIYILNNKGDIVSEIGHEEEHEDEDEDEDEEEYTFYQDPLYLQGKENSYLTNILFDEDFGVKGFAVSAPILDDNKLLGVIILKIGLEGLFEITLNRQGLGETGETYLVNDEKFLVTPSRFLRGEEKGVLVQKIDTENTRDCFNESVEGHFAEIEPIISFLDYRGEEAIGTHREVSNVSWCLIIKIDKNESLDVLLKDYIIHQIVVGLIAILILTLAGFFTGRYFEKKRGKKRK